MTQTHATHAAAAAQAEGAAHQPAATRATAAVQPTERVWLYDPPAPPGTRLPTEEELPSSDGLPMETERHVLQMLLLMETLALAWQDRDDVHIAGDMFVYFSPLQVLSQDFRGPDVFVATGVVRRERKSWVVWEEGKPPDVVIELTSASTEKVDRIVKKRIYQNELRVPEYVMFDPFSAELTLFRLEDGVYHERPLDDDGGVTTLLGVRLVLWPGRYRSVDAVWLRWAEDRRVLPTGAELADAERSRADDLRRRVAALEAQLAQQPPPTRER